MASTKQYKSLTSVRDQNKAKQYFKSKDEYLAIQLKLQKKLLSLQQQIHRSGKRVIVVLEGQDASGKGGVIRRMTEKLDPRGFVVHSIGAPKEEEKRQHYLQRFFSKLPEPGKIVFFDRSWYGRVLVERVEGYCKNTEWQRAYMEIAAFEKMLTDDGIALIKLCLDVSYNEQEDRFIERKKNPFKKWKLTNEDWRNRKHWAQNLKAMKDMIKKTSTEIAPWHVIAADSKWFARIQSIEILIKNISI